MSEPPGYKHQFDEEESVGLLTTSGGNEPQQHVYPPSAAVLTSAPAGQKSVVLQFRPKWPLTKYMEQQDAMSLIGRDRAETLQLAMTAFPVLKQFDEDRIAFLVPSDLTAPITWSTKFAKITDSAWNGLASNAALNAIVVEIADGPGDAAARRRHEVLVTTAWILGPILGVIFFFVCFYFVVTYFGL